MPAHEPFRVEARTCHKARDKKLYWCRPGLILIPAWLINYQVMTTYVDLKSVVAQVGDAYECHTLTLGRLPA